MPKLSRERQIELARLAKEGDEVAHAELMETGLKVVRGIARFYCEKWNCWLIFDDLESDGGLELVRCWPNFDLTRGILFLTYAYKCVRFRMLTRLQGRTPDTSLDELLQDGKLLNLAADGLSPEDALLTDERTIELTQALNCLPEKQRKAVNLRYFEHLSVEEISSVLAIPVGTVKSDLFKARDSLWKNPKFNQVAAAFGFGGEDNE